MMTPRYFFLLGAVAVALTGCSTLNSLTGQTDNTVLPGQREDAIPGRAQFPDQPDPLVQRPASGQDDTQTASTADPIETCNPDDPACQPSVGSGEPFSDPQ